MKNHRLEIAILSIIFMGVICGNLFAAAGTVNVAGIESEIEAVIDLQDCQGAVTDAQVPNTITIDQSSLALTGDSATAFFSTGTLEDALIPSSITRDTEAALAYEPLKGADDNFVTDAEKTVLGNTSGTNSGDEATFNGAGVPGIVPDPTTDDGRLLDTGGWTDTVSVDILGFSANSMIYADPTGTLQPHPTVDMLEAGMLDGAVENIQNAIDALQAGSGETSLTVTAGGESSDEIAVTIAALPAGNYLSEVWLSDTDGGTVTTAFDTWTDSDSTVHEVKTASVNKLLLTGTDGDAVITFAEDNEVTKYLCAEVSGKVACAECAFSAETSVCTESAYHTVSVSGNLPTSYSTAYYLAQRLKNLSLGTICTVAIKLGKIAGDDGVYHVEIWTVGTDNAGATMAATSSQIGGDSDSITVTTDTTAEEVFFTWTTNTKPEWTTGFVFAHLVKESGPNAYWVADGNQNLYPAGDDAASTYDLWYNGADVSADGVFTVYFE